MSESQGPRVLHAGSQLMLGRFAELRCCYQNASHPRFPRAMISQNTPLREEPGVRRQHMAGGGGRAQTLSKRFSSQTFRFQVKGYLDLNKTVKT